MRKLSNGEEKVYEANISLFDALKFTDSDKKGKFDLKRFIAAHCIILAIEEFQLFILIHCLQQKMMKKLLLVQELKET